MHVPDEHKAIAKTVWATFGGPRPRIYEYKDDNHERSVAIQVATDCPEKGLSAASTIGVSDHSIGQEEMPDKPLRVEFLGTFANEDEVFCNILSTCAFNVINTKFKCWPGAIYRDVVAMYLPESPMKHVFFVPPFDLKPEDIDFPAYHVTWLQAIPISEGEYQYAVKHGTEALMDLLEERNADIADLFRDSVV